MLHMFTGCRQDVERRLAAFEGRPVSVSLRLSEALQQEKCYDPYTDRRLKHCRDNFDVEFDKG